MRHVGILLLVLALALAWALPARAQEAVITGPTAVMFSSKVSYGGEVETQVLLQVRQILLAAGVEVVDTTVTRYDASVPSREELSEVETYFVIGGAYLPNRGNLFINANIAQIILASLLEGSEAKVTFEIFKRRPGQRLPRLVGSVNGVAKVSAFTAFGGISGPINVAGSTQHEYIVASIVGATIDAARKAGLQIPSGPVTAPGTTRMVEPPAQPALPATTPSDSR